MAISSFLLERHTFFGPLGNVERFGGGREDGRGLWRAPDNKNALLLFGRPGGEFFFFFFLVLGMMTE